MLKERARFRTRWTIASRTGPDYTRHLHFAATIAGSGPGAPLMIGGRRDAGALVARQRFSW
jgi:hypothetical protein